MISWQGRRQDPAGFLKGPAKALKDPAECLKDPARVLKGVENGFHSQWYICTNSSTFVLL
jgi:hypothetical protein